MDNMLLTTKLQIPPRRHSLVSRHRLIAKLDIAQSSRLTLITAPAGFGKTTLMRDWLENCSFSVGWLSLDEHDNNLRRFFLYLIHACRALDPEIGTQALALLESSHQPHPTTLLTHLVNDLSTLDSSGMIILDDYHLMTDSSIHDATDFLINNLPPTIHLMIASRSQLSLNLARLRSQAQLLELNSADLRFTAPEVEKFLSDVMHLDLSSADRTALEIRTEGWIAGVQLAGLTLQAQENKSEFIASLSGTDRYIADYLVEEVLQHQTAKLQQFLLYSAIVDDLCSGLCDAILNTHDSQTTLEYLDARHLFIVPLDNQRHWFRYHHLFLELLRHHLHHTYPDQITALHLRASQWYESKGRFDDAIRHGFLAEDFDRTAELIENAFQQTDWVHRDMHRLLDWFNALPETVTQSRPKLKLAYAWLLFEIFSDQWGRIEAQLRDVENFLTTLHASETFSTSEINQMLAQVHLLRANHARHTDNPAAVIELCQQALNLLPENETYIYSGVIAHLASAYESLGDMRQANDIYTKSIQLCRAADNIDGLLFSTARLIEVLIIAGQLRHAHHVFEQAKPILDQRTGPDVGMIYIAIAEVYRLQNRLDEAHTYLERGIELCRPFAAWQSALIIGVSRLAHVFNARNNIDHALGLLADAEKQLLAPNNQKQIDRTRLHLLLSDGKFTSAVQLVRKHNLSLSADPNYDQEPDYLLLIRLLITQASLDAQGIHSIIAPNPLDVAMNLLEYLHDNAIAGDRVGRIIQINMLWSMVYQLLDDVESALDKLELALSLAEPENIIHPFIDAGTPLQELLIRLKSKPLQTLIAPDYINALLAAYLSTKQSADQINLRGNSLTKSELRTLKLLATDYSTEEIAAELSVAISTVRTYLKRIYSKLNAHSRAEAVYLAKALNIL